MEHVTTALRVASSSLRLRARNRLTGADGFFATIRASVSLSSASAVNRPEDVVSSAASRLANIDVVFFIVIGPSPESQCVT
jgi:hypothetical protein